MIGAAIGTAAALIVGELILVNLYLYFSVKINIVRFYYQLLKSVAPVMILPTLVAFYLRESFANSWIGLMLGCALTLVMYVGLAFFLALSQNEKRIVLNWCRVTQK